MDPPVVDKEVNSKIKEKFKEEIQTNTLQSIFATKQIYRRKNLQIH